MKKQFNKIYIILLGIIIVGKLSNWFLNYSDKTNDLLNTVLFTLIGVGFVIESFTLYKKEFKLIFLICGIYLIAMNFIDNFQLKSLIGIVSIVDVVSDNGAYVIDLTNGPQHSVAGLSSFMSREDYDAHINFDRYFCW